MKLSTSILILALLVIVAGGVWWIVSRPAPVLDTAVAPVAKSSQETVTYTIDGTPVTLINGHAEVESAPGSASKTITDYFGNAAAGDLNGDDIPDLVFILSQTTGGSGTFYYVVATLKLPDGPRGTNAILLGDRIAPQTTEIKNGEIIVNYADRAPHDPMTAQPSVGVSKYLKVQNGLLVETKHR